MNTSSFLIVGGATTLGAAAIFLIIQFGMDASDDYASKLSVTSEEYLKIRAKAVAMGKDASKIKGNAARSQMPSTYDKELSPSLTSPYLRADSDKILDGALGNNFDITEAVKGNGITNSRGNSNSNTAMDSDSVVAANAGLSESELSELIDIAKKDSTRNSADGSSNNNESNARSQSSTQRQSVSQNRGSSARSTTTASQSVIVDDDLEDNIYTVHDEIRHQLATETMSDEKRAMLESLLPQEAPKAVRAVNVLLQFDTRNCVVPRNSNSFIGVMFRPESRAIRGSSLTDLDELIVMRERCNGALVLEDHADAQNAKDSELRESRRDEVKYYLLQRQVPAERIISKPL